MSDDDETLGGQRHNSTSGGKDYYYPSIDELLAADSKGFKRLTGKLTKDSILCLLRDSLGHLKQAKLTSDHFSKIENKLDNLITNTEISPDVTPPSVSSGKSTMADIIKASLDERDYNEQANKTIVFYNVEETKDVNDNVDPTIKEVFAKIEQNTVMIESAHRLGKKNESNTRPRPIEVKLSTEFDKRKVMANARLLKGTNLFVKPKLLWKDRLIEKALLSLRYDLTQNGFSKNLFRIRDLKLFYNGHHIDSTSPVKDIIRQLPNLTPVVH